MDVRHETKEEQLINSLIEYINQIMLSEKENLVRDKQWRNHLIRICQSLYLYICQDADVEHILSNKNLLSIDVVLLPDVHDVNKNVIKNRERFQELIHTLHDELMVAPTSEHERKQKADMIAIMNESDNR